MLRVRDKGIRYLVMLWRRDDAMAASGSPAEDQVVQRPVQSLLRVATAGSLAAVSDPEATAGSLAAVSDSEATAGSLAAVSDPASPSRGRSGRNRYDWVEVCREQTDAEIRPAAKLWLRQHDILHTTLQWSSDRGTKTLLTHCKKCQSCTKMWCFRIQASQQRELVVEVAGKCGSEDATVMKKKYATQHAQQHSPAKALLKMKQDGVPVGQLKNQRPSCRPKDREFSTDCLAELQKFLADPPACIRIIQEHVVCTKKEVCIPFVCPCTHAILQDSGLHSFVMDFTYKTNRDGLLLGCIGPLGLLQLKNSLPSVRMVPAVFCLSSAENEAAHVLLLDLFLQHCELWNLNMTDAFLDCSCLHAVRKACAEAPRKMYLHRCLQHVKKNVREESARKNSETGTPRLVNKELLSVLVDSLMFSATLPADIQFHAYWDSILSRMEGTSKPTDFKEPEMAQYLRKHILDDTGLGSFVVVVVVTSSGSSGSSSSSSSSSSSRSRSTFFWSAVYREGWW